MDPHPQHLCLGVPSSPCSGKCCVRDLDKRSVRSSAGSGSTDIPVDTAASEPCTWPTPRMAPGHIRFAAQWHNGALEILNHELKLPASVISYQRFPDCSRLRSIRY